MVDEQELEDTARLEANLSTEVGKIALDMLAEFTRHYKVSGHIFVFNYIKPNYNELSYGELVEHILALLGLDC